MAESIVHRIGTAVWKLASAVNPLGGVDVNIQDQITTPFNFKFGRIIGVPTTLAVATEVDDQVVTLTDASGCSVGDSIGLFNADDPSDNRAYFGTVLSKSVNDVTLDTPLDFAFQPGDTVACFSNNMNVDGSVTPQVFSIEVGSASSQSIDITRLMYRVLTTGSISLALFGDQPRLAKGIVLRRVNGRIHNIWNVKDNGEIAGLAFDYVTYSSINPIQGQNGLLVRYTFAGQDKHGVAVRLDPGDRLELIIQDDLTDLQEFKIVAEGHYVDP